MEYFKDGDELGKWGNIVAYDLVDDLTIQKINNQESISFLSDYGVYRRQIFCEQMAGYGLEIGLGLGLASRAILNCNNVVNLTTVEKDINIINAHSDLSELINKRLNLDYKHTKHSIVNCEGLEYIYSFGLKYDFVFLNFYKIVDENTLPEIEDMIRAAKTICDGPVFGWFDQYASSEDILEYFKLYNKAKEVNIHESWDN